jgi:3-methyladenine DNA glycosylase Tag
MKFPDGQNVRSIRIVSLVIAMFMARTPANSTRNNQQLTRLSPAGAIQSWRNQMTATRDSQSVRFNLKGFVLLTSPLVLSVGSTVVYAHMQAVGMVNDHLVDCFRYRELRQHWKT